MNSNKNQHSNENSNKNENKNVNNYKNQDRNQNSNMNRNNNDYMTKKESPKMLGKRAVIKKMETILIASCSTK